MTIPLPEKRKTPHRRERERFGLPLIVFCWIVSAHILAVFAFGAYVGSKALFDFLLWSLQ